MFLLFLLQQFFCLQMFLLQPETEVTFYEEVKEEGNQFSFKCTNLSLSNYFSFQIIEPNESYESYRHKDFHLDKEYVFNKKGIYQIIMSNDDDEVSKVSVRSYVESSFPADEHQVKLREVVTSLESLLGSTLEANIQLRDAKVGHIKELRSLLRKLLLICFFAIFYFFVGFYKVEKMKALFSKRK